MNTSANRKLTDKPWKISSIRCLT